ncbi:sodium:solute symporter [Aureibacter tunicatorum]|uniref:Na+/proline symporter n=1 Tax=Aureibacter tunicatorum TaxID=866807 RepID=A0AAE3XPQ5_9BACT|nr:sodium:solute symporter [Aureibacter tunicatorum]MDR6239044.1 Na+/proline symporter [Aureibacter tunicatorum]BDD05030.1 sodium:solute symporter [Aureibacter tunicatorum]
MSSYWILFAFVSYFFVLWGISKIASAKTDNLSFFTAGHRAPWYIIAVGMIGTSLSGVTFLSVPGEVSNNSMHYFQFVIGNFLGYLVIGRYLLPFYYKKRYVSIYQFFQERYGQMSQRTGAFSFLVAQLAGAAFRLFLVALVFDQLVFSPLGIPFEVAVMIIVFAIWLYTRRGGLKSIVWTDAIQTVLLLGAMIATLSYVINQVGGLDALRGSRSAVVMDWDWKSPTFAIKQIVAGFFLTLVMNGLDQNMMQKNLACKNSIDGQKNIYSFSIVFVIVNLLFLILGVGLFEFTDVFAVTVPAKTDFLYSYLTMNHFPFFLQLLFILGVCAAAYSSADSSLTSLTTSFCVDILSWDNEKLSSKISERGRIHIAFSVILFLIIICFYRFNDQSVVTMIFKFAGYAYGPLLGMFVFGFFTNIKTFDRLVPIFAILSPIGTWIFSLILEQWLPEYKVGFELILFNGVLMFCFLLSGNIIQTLQKPNSMPTKFKVFK